MEGKDADGRLEGWNGGWPRIFPAFFRQRPVQEVARFPDLQEHMASLYKNWNYHLSRPMFRIGNNINALQN
jgi:hypothetical protein